MPMWPCHFCSKPSVVWDGDCDLCNRHLCSEHLEKRYHECPSIEEDPDKWRSHHGRAQRELFNKLFDSIDTAALENEANSLRQGTKCKVSPLKYGSVLAGGLNLHISITFDDGVQWLARFRQLDARSPRPEVQEYLVESEVATYAWLSKTGVPVPKIYGWAPAGNAVGPAYILMEKLAGVPYLPSDFSARKRKRIADQLADIYIKLSEHPVPTVGSFSTPPNIEISRIASSWDVDYNPDNSKVEYLGPFDSWQDCLVAKQELTLKRIATKQLFPSWSVEAYLIHKFLLEQSTNPLFNGTNASQHEGHSSLFYLYHADARGDHMLVDPDTATITGMIDWEMAFTAPANIAFMSPYGFMDPNEFFKGEAELNEDEVLLARAFEAKQRQDLADYIWHGRIQHQYLHLCDSFGMPKGDALSLLGGLRRSLSGGESVGDFDSFKEAMLKKYITSDARLKSLVDRENENENAKHANCS